MASALFATGLALVVVPLIGLIVWKLDNNPVGALQEVLRVAGVTVLCVIMWSDWGCCFEVKLPPKTNSLSSYRTNR